MKNQAYKLPLKKVGEDVIIWEKAQIIKPEVIAIGDSVIIDDFVFFSGGAGATLGSFIHIASHVSIAGSGEFTMGDFSGISGGTRVYTANEDYLGGCLTNPAVPAPYRMPILSYVRIGKHAIIGANAVILPGVTIGEGAVVGAQSLVTRDCEPWTINMGSPAKAVRERKRERMLELEAELRANLYTPNGDYISRTNARTL
jgi:acetyltransferase-like isoleucine patch superfamily enzyme